MEFEFDPDKARRNLEKHGIDFADVEPVFLDERALEQDVEWPTEQAVELRHVRVGTDAQNRVITVVWTRRGDRIRLISARHARKKEKEGYEQA